MSTFIDRVSITSVRGISGTIDLDLRSPLTVVYAPNGTGKTSVWSALQALLLGKEVTNLQCELPGVPPFSIEAELSTQTGRAVAQLAKNQALNLRSNDGKIHSGTSALSMLAPECNISGLQTKGGAVSNRLAEHIRSARLLPSESLLHLIDDSANGIETRRQLFADLTGTASLQIEQRELKNYLDRLTDHQKGLDDRRKQRKMDHEQQTAEVKQGVAEAQSLIGQAFSLLGCEAGESQDDSQLSAIRTELGNRRSFHEVRARKLRDLTALLTANSNLPVAIEELESQITSRRRELEDAEKSLTGVDEKIAANEKELRRNRRTAPVVSDVSEVLSSRMAELTLVDPSGAVSLASIRKFVGNANRHSLAKASNIVERLISSSPEWQGIDEKIADLSSRIEALTERLRDGSSSGEIEDQLRKIDARILEHSKHLEEIEGLHASVLSAAQELLSRRPDSQCPCCTHDWGTSAQLLAAVQKARQRGSFNSAASDVASWQIERTQKQSLWSETAAREQQLREHKSELAQMTATRTRLDSEFASIGLQLSSSVDNLNELREILAGQVACLEILEKVERLEVSPDDQILLAQLQAKMDGELHALRTQETLKAALDDELANERNRLRSLLENKRPAQRADEHRLSDLRTLSAKQRELASELHLDANDLEAGASEVHTALGEEEVALNRVSELCDQISASLANGRAVQLAQGMAREVEQLDQQRQIVSDEISRSQALSTALQSSERAVSAQFFETLSPAIAALFNHMQVNRVFSTITLKLAEESFSMRGTLKEEVELTPTHFSQGQRQDLALSMFLVRACTLGGSFLLDEPLLHLDDLNRTALLDCLRACVIGTRDSPRPVRLFVTTASWSVARHLVQKFASIKSKDDVAALTVYSLTGNVDSGVIAQRLPGPTQPAAGLH